MRGRPQGPPPPPDESDDYGAPPPPSPPPSDNDDAVDAEAAMEAPPPPPPPSHVQYDALPILPVAGGGGPPTSHPVLHKAGHSTAKRGSVFHGVPLDLLTAHTGASGLTTVQPAYFKKLSTGLVARWQKRWFWLSNNYLLYAAVEDESSSSAADAVSAASSSSAVGATSIDLRRVESITNASKGSAFEFNVVGEGLGGTSIEEGDAPGVFRVRVNSKVELDLWVSAMRQRQSFVFNSRKPHDAASAAEAAALAAREFAEEGEERVSAAEHDALKARLAEAIARCDAAEAGSVTLRATLASRAAEAEQLRGEFKACDEHLRAVLAEKEAQGLEFEALMSTSASRAEGDTARMRGIVEAKVREHIGLLRRQDLVRQREAAQREAHYKRVDARSAAVEAQCATLRAAAVEGEVRCRAIAASNDLARRELDEVQKRLVRAERFSQRAEEMHGEVAAKVSAKEREIAALAEFARQVEARFDAMQQRHEAACAALTAACAGAAQREKGLVEELQARESEKNAAETKVEAVRAEVRAVEMQLDEARTQRAVVRAALDAERAKVASVAGDEARAAAAADAAKVAIAREAVEAEQRAAERLAAEHEARVSAEERVKAAVADERAALETQRTFLEAEARSMAEERDAMRLRLEVAQRLTAEATAARSAAELAAAALAERTAALDVRDAEAARTRTVVEYERAQLVRQREAVISEKDRWYRGAEEQRRNDAVRTALRRETEAKEALAAKLAVIDVVAESRRRAEASAASHAQQSSGYGGGVPSTPLPPFTTATATMTKTMGDSGVGGRPHVHINRSNSIFIS